MITVLRYGHRPGRDKRVTTHCGLVARAFGADRFVLTTRDESVLRSLQDIVDRWGGPFEVAVEENWRQYLRGFRGTRVHLTMYGIPVDEAVKRIDPSQDLLVFVGAEKVPPEVYDVCELNVAVGNQPHSEIAALAIFLDRLFGGRELEREFRGKVRVEPMERGKKLINLEGSP